MQTIQCYALFVTNPFAWKITGVILKFITYRCIQMNRSRSILMWGKPLKPNKWGNSFGQNWFEINLFFVLLYSCSKTQSNANDTEKRNKDKDLITLTGAGHITQWRFPKNLTRCPVSNCQKKCSTRSAAIEHYKNHHAIRAILCSICDKPVAAKTYDSFIEHYRKQHPQFDAPLDFKQSGNVNSYQTIQANVVSFPNIDKFSQIIHAVHPFHIISIG